MVNINSTDSAIVIAAADLTAFFISSDQTVCPIIKKGVVIDSANEPA